MSRVPILDMTPTGRYADGAPMYSFHTSYPTRGVRKLDDAAIRKTAKAAHVAGEQALARMLNMWTMGQVCGVTKVPGGYVAVINTYVSNS